MNKLKIGDTFHMGRIDCKVTEVDSFGCTPHYGFTYRTDSGDYQSGWMPVLFVDNFTGHSLAEVALRGSWANFDGAARVGKA